MNGRFDKIVSHRDARSRGACLLWHLFSTAGSPAGPRWHGRFNANRDQVTQLGFDRMFQRKWAYYLGSCEAAFRERVLGNLQLVLTREGNRRLAN
jgi:hypothetical protein